MANSPHSGPLQSKADTWPIALVSMPFVSIEVPSIQIGLLKAIARTHGFQVANLHLSLDFACQIGRDLYGVLANHRGHLFGDWLFSTAAFRSNAPDDCGYFLRDFGSGIEEALRPFGERAAECLWRLREIEVPQYLRRLIDDIPWGSFRLVGFSSTFQQSAASFALAAQIKERYPNVCTVFGGANFDGEMGLELVRTVGCVDYAIIGEADQAFPEFLAALRDGRDPGEIAGVACRRGGKVCDLTSRPPFAQIDDLPVPDYDDFFERADALGMFRQTSSRDVRLPFESSRGCWWGQKHHCTFCGLNNEGMAFRAKSADRVLAELAELSRRHKTFRFQAVDNIVSMNYFQTLLPKLVEEGYHYDLFYETKSNLKREHIKLLSEAGVRSIQPGIESLSSHVLDLMCKGVSAIQNVNLLRWASYYGICVTWNIIWGFPGETREDYEQQALLIPHLVHLQPPLSAARIWMERFSPIFADRDRFPAKSVRAEASYAYVYPTYVDHQRVAYFFDYEFEDGLPESVYEPIVQLSQSWQRAWQSAYRPRLTFRASPDFVRIEDFRDCRGSLSYNLSGPVASLYAGSSNNPQTPASLKRNLRLEWTEDHIEKAMTELCEQGLMMRDGALFLSLAVPTSPHDETHRA